MLFPIKMIQQASWAFTLVLMCLSQGLMAQGYTFKVLAVKGANEVNQGGTWQPVKTGAALQSNEELKIPEQGYLGLVHSGGKTLELKEAGTYKVADLANKVLNNGASVASKYADYILEKISAEDKKNRLSATGAVHRNIADDAQIQLLMPSSTKIFNSEVRLHWSEINGSPTYQVSLENMFEDILVVEETAKPEFLLNMESETIQKENVFFIKVKAKKDANVKSSTYVIKRLPKAEHDKVAKDLSVLMKGMTETTALNEYILAAFFEQNGLLVDAIDRFSKAIELAPGVDSYKIAFEDFIARNGLKN